MKKLLVAIAGILWVSNMAFAQATTLCQTYSISGSVIIATRDYPEYIEVSLLSNMGEERISKTNLDSNNRFVMTGLPQGEFDIVIRVPGFKETRERVLVKQNIGVLVPDNNECELEGIYWLVPVDSLVVADQKIRGYPKEAVDEYALAIEASQSKRYEEVVKHLEVVVKLAEDWFDARCALGAAYENVHRGKDAEAQYRAALVLKPENFRALMSLGRLLVAEADEKGQDPAAHDAVLTMLHQARETLSSAILKDPKSAMASYLMGAVDFRLADYPAAETELNHALELDMEIYPARIMLINVYVLQKRWQDALDNADAFIIENPASPYRPEVMTTRASIVRRLQSSNGTH